MEVLNHCKGYKGLTLEPFHSLFKSRAAVVVCLQNPHLSQVTVFYSNTFLHSVLASQKQPSHPVYLCEQLWNAVFRLQLILVYFPPKVYYFIVLCLELKGLRAKVPSSSFVVAMVLFFSLFPSPFTYLIFKPPPSPFQLSEARNCTGNIP